MLTTIFLGAIGYVAGKLGWNISAAAKRKAAELLARRAEAAGKRAADKYLPKGG